jgi:3-oxoacyl-[acyl-carrier protein] reductase
MKLNGKVAVITGGASGMGLAAGILFGKEGAKVVVADIDLQNGQKAVETIQNNGGEAVFVKVDLTKENEVEKMISVTVEEFGQLNILYNNAGFPQKSKPLEFITNEEWEQIFNVNVRSIFWGTKYALPELKKAGNGVILNTGSVAGQRPRPGSVCYAASKGAVITITRALAVELAQFNIRVNCINPGPTYTPMLPKFTEEFTEEVKEKIVAGTPLGRFVTPEDIAYAALYLASDEAQAVTGTVVNVDSGLYIGRGAH